MQPLSLRWQAWMARQTRSRAATPPLRAEIFNVEQLERHARALAHAQEIDSTRSSNRLLARLDANEESLREFNRVSHEVTPRRRITPAAEWLLDNFYLIEEQIQMARWHLPRGYSRELPRIRGGPAAGLPRVYEIGLELISHVDAQIDIGPLNAFVAAYQSVTSLRLGELWAIPIMLSLGLIENLQRITTQLTSARLDRDLADFWAERLQDMAETNASRLIIVVADMAKAEVPLTSSFVAEFSQRLSRQNPILHLARSWLEQRLAEQGQSIEELVQLESQKQAADQVSVSHSIASLRFLSALDSKAFVEGLSVVEKALQGDPAGVYPRMDFLTRDRYRHAIESISRRSEVSEDEAARTAVRLAEEASKREGSGSKEGHVGYFLIGKGQPALERATKARLPARTAIERCILRFPFTYYQGGIFLITLLTAAEFVRQCQSLGVHGWRLGFIAAIFTVCVSQLAVSLMNWLSTQLVKPRLLPRLDFSSGIAPESRTMVVVPTLLTTVDEIDRLVEMLEVYHLSNRDQNLHFALLTDFRDAPKESMPNDQILLERARRGIVELNQGYQSENNGLFFLLHRPRRWNAADGVWMGYERKRGKLTDLNLLLRGAPPARFSEIVGDLAVLKGVKYVITLDSDTQLPRDAARELAGTMAHCLNRPEFDPKLGVVTDGYSIMQPRVGVSLPSANRSRFVRLFAGNAGIDPYTRAVSDVYQDLFQEGSYIGKGIYDVDAFQQAMAGRCPENSVLSHDLLESCHARSALVSDVELYEEFPSRYNVDVSRRHRWIRGDWQIMRWLLPRVPAEDNREIANPLSPLAQWKILDNLRRSLVPGALLLFLLATWFLVPQLAALGSTLVVVIVTLSGLLTVLVGALRKPADIPWLVHLRGEAEAAARQFGQILMSLAFLPYDTLVTMDAVVRTLARVLVTRRRLLEWQTSSDSARSSDSSLSGFLATMWIAPFVAVVCGMAMAWKEPSELPGTLPLLAAWFLAPPIAWWLSRTLVAAPPRFSPEQVTFLRNMARKTWYFFETFVSETDSWLPPDNFQEVPAPTIATRTSPTNMGLSLLANLAACDFGYLSVGRLIERTENTFGTMRQLERYRGHFYNWYDTRERRPIRPLYVSSVDSGNLAGHLLTYGSGLRGLADEKIISSDIFAGIRDTLGVLREYVGKNDALDRLDAELARPPASMSAASALLEEAAGQAIRVAETANIDTNDAKGWSEAFRADCVGHRDDLSLLALWLSLSDPSSIFGLPPVAKPGTGRRGSIPPSEALAKLRDEFHRLDRGPTLRELSTLDERLAPILEEASAECEKEPSDAVGERKVWMAELMRLAHEASERARQRILTLEKLADESSELAAMDFTFLYDQDRHLLSIGFNVPDHRRDPSFYDLLASESRLASYVAVAQGQVPQDHWFALGRLLVPSPRGPVLVSWSGSMFEYLLPVLVMPSYENTLLEHTCKSAVEQQIEYGTLRGVPWGISESGYNLTDVNLNYQYRAFGVPGLGLKRGLADDLVVAPYASAMALMVAPLEACANLQRLARDGREGAFGLYEAIDYTPSRLPPGESSVTIRSFMAHHQGMSLLALVNLLRGNPMLRRFLACPVLKAADLLLQERLPKTQASAFTSDVAMIRESRQIAGNAESVMRVFNNPNSSSPEVHLLSNGRYHVVITNSGGGYSRRNDLALTRWREDATCDSWGTFLYLRDVSTGEYWSAAYQPTQRATKRYEAIFTQARAEYRQNQSGIEAHTEICVSPEDDVELRRITLTNNSSGRRVIEVTSYAEVVLAAQAADLAHPAFSNLFVQTELAAPAILCTRRASSPEEKPPWLLNLMVGRGGEQGEISCETDRLRFLGRGGSPAAPAAMRDTLPLSNTFGSVLDPIIALRRTVSLAANETASVDVITGVGDTREAALGLVEKYQNPRTSDRAFELAWTHSQVTLRHLDATEGEAQLYGRLAGALIFVDPARRAGASVLRNNRRGQSGLWSYGISGDLPIVLLRIGSADKIEIVRQLLHAHSYWRLKGLTVDLVILNEDASTYRQSLQEQITSLIASGIQAQMLEKPGGIFVRRLEQVPNDDRVLLQSVARIVLDDENGTLAEQMERRNVQEPMVSPLVPSRTVTSDVWNAPTGADLTFDNGLGGFTQDGREYVITLQPGETTPAPWVNVIANSSFGTVVSECGSAYSWSENAHEFRLTPWSNDPIRDTPGEALYIRDEHTGQFWSPTPAPARGATPYVIRHGFGYTVFEHVEHGIRSELWLYVAMDSPVKFSVLKLRNLSGRNRRISVTGYCEWVLGELRQKSLMHVQSEVDLRTGALLARNHYNTDFPDRIAFIDVNDSSRSLTGDRKEFLGRNGSLARPAALRRTRLSGKVGAGLDPCGAVQVAFDLPDGTERETIFRLGAGRSLSEVQGLVQRFRRAEASRIALEGVWSYWTRTLSAVTVETPDPAVNVMANGWLLYQTLSARFWGRTGFYQSSGAFGFRDQMQDVMALVHAEPTLTREHLLRAAAHQFREGDVQHWWHPPIGRGVRTHISDDFLWLPYAICRYVSCLADIGVLDERIPFIEGRPIKPEEESYYDLPNRSDESATLYEHGVRAIERGLRFGAHGLPLMGGGDWNDGMNRVGNKGSGESVWLAFFLFDVLKRYAEIARLHGDLAFAERCLAQARQLQHNIEQHAWDGQWYRRAYFDDGEPLGSQSNPECQIDSLPQSWSVISGAGDPLRSRIAMQSVDQRLVRRESGLVQLFDPPFDKSPLNPGYIKGYIPGVRENGGQYTHGAVWAAMAFALMGDGERAWELLSLLNPVHHSLNHDQLLTYKVEPYVVAADVYAVAPHVGRGGWTWYTGSAGWMYRLLVETLLGIELEGEKLRLSPCLPASWTGYRIHYRFRQTLYHVTLRRVAADTPEAALFTLDGKAIPGPVIPLTDDRQEHEAQIGIRDASPEPNQANGAAALESKNQAPQLENA
jgi:cyclic beta-1,2-glucan synthetase